MKNEILTIIVIIVSITLYIFFVRYMIQQKNELKKAYIIQTEKAIFLNNITQYMVPSIRNKDFLKMTNDGDNPCDLDREISYINYIGNSSMYMEKNTNG